MRYLTLFDEHSEIEYSPAFTIFPGSIGVLTAFNLGKKITPAKNEPKNSPQQFIIQKLIFEDGGIFNGHACSCDDDSPIGFHPEFTYAEDVTQCGTWNLNACQNIGAIMLPGTYRIRFNDLGGLGYVHLSLTRYTQDEAGFVPRKLIFGE